MDTDLILLDSGFLNPCILFLCTENVLMMRDGTADRTTIWMFSEMLDGQHKASCRESLRNY